MLRIVGLVGTTKNILDVLKAILLRRSKTTLGYIEQKMRQWREPYRSQERGGCLVLSRARD